MVKKVLILAIFLVGAFIGGGLISQPAQAQRGTSYPNCGAIKGTGYFTVAQTGSTRFPGSYYSTQRQGNSNSCVRNIQVALNAVCSSGTRLVVDGVYGSKTARAVTNYQKYWASAPWYTRVNGRALGVDGIVGPQTWILLTTSYNEASVINCAA